VSTFKTKRKVILGINDLSVKEALNTSLGKIGSTFVNDTTVRTGKYFCIQVLADTVFTTLTDTSRDGTAVGTFVFKVGTVIYGNFTAITLASGTVLAYKG
jgi:hypothetical protein